MRIMIFGKNGQLGSELTRLLSKTEEVFSYDFPEIDFMLPISIGDLIKKIKPALVINAAAYTNVDGAETEQEKVFIINAETVGHIAEITSNLGCGFIHYSTDYVFDGKKGSLYVEEDEPNPISIYGKSKLKGETLALEKSDSTVVFRTSWVYSLTLNNFVTKVLKWARNNTVLKIVDDQISSPTWAKYLAKITADVIRAGQDDIAGFLKKNQGLYHLSGKGAVSRYDWAKRILLLDSDKESQIAEEVVPAKSNEFSTPATRPLFSCLDCSKFEQKFNIKLKDWEISLDEAFNYQK